MEASERLTSGQVAKLLGVHRTTVNYWHDTGRLTPIDEINGTRVYSRSAVERIKAERDAADAARNAEAAS